MKNDPVTARMREELAALHTSLSHVSARVRLLRSRTEQLSAVRAGEQHADAQIAALESVLDDERVSGHVRASVEHSELRSDPVPHLVIADLLPRDVYRAVVEAIPPPVLFDGRAAKGQLGVPPRLAPADAIVTWMFFSHVVARIAGPLVARFAESLQAYARERFPSAPPLSEWDGEITLTAGRIVRRTPGDAGSPPHQRPWEFLIGVLDLARDQDGEEYGSRLDGAVIPFRANTALVCVGPAGRRAYAPIPRDAPANVERYTYEFCIGPTRNTRHRIDTRERAV